VIENIYVILVATTHPGNIGASARAMKNMGLKNLILVNPKHLPNQESYARAAGADDILHNAQIVHNLEQALQDCTLSFAISARKRSLSWRSVSVKECASCATYANTKGSKVGLVFGREHAGLTNLELQQCKYQVYIEANPLFSSLNLAAAVQVISYEIFQQFTNNYQTKNDQNTIFTNKNNNLVTNLELENFYTHLEQVLMQINFLSVDKKRSLMARLRRLYAKANLDKVELNILRGILTKTEQSLPK